MKEPRFETLSIHGGKEQPPKRALNHPIFMTSTFTFDSLQHANATFDFQTDDYVYTRGNNPTLKVLEQRLAALEGGADAVAFASGMAAISSVLLSLLKPGDELITHGMLYGSSWNFAKNLLPQYGIAHSMLDLTDIDSLPQQLGENTRVIYFETPANPSLDIIDIQAVCKVAHARGIKVVVDNTFATPYFQRPLALGADVVVHSATKYLSGHGDVVAGIAVAKDQQYLQKLKFDYMCELGGVMSPFNGWLLLRGIKTLALRMREHEKNAQLVAEFLAAHPRVARVYYPGLPSFGGHQVARQQMQGFGSMVSFDVHGTVEQSKAVADATKLFKLAVSLGDCESLIQHPFAMTHRDYSKEEIETAGLNANMIRLSVGLEHRDDLIADLEQALASI